MIGYVDQNDTDRFFMQMALEEAGRARDAGEVPVGAVLVDVDNRMLARGCNHTIECCDPTAHAEMFVLRQGARILGNYRLLSTTLYATIEPCVMCMGAIIHARVARLVYGAPDPKWGAAGSLYDIARDARLNHQPVIVSGVYEADCRAIIQDFFKLKRAQAKIEAGDMGLTHI